MNQQLQGRNPLKKIGLRPILIGAVPIIISMIIAIIIGIVTSRVPETGIIYETINETNVLDLKRPLQDLSIEFRGQNIEEENLSLRILTVSISIIGDIHILNEHFDQDDDWGMKFDNGKVIEARLVEASSDYLQTKMMPQIVGESSVVFPKTIFDRDASFVVEVLTLHSKHELPSFSSIGKIAGIDEITVLTRPLVVHEESFIGQLFEGSFVIQLVRIGIYIIGAVLAMVMFVLMVIAISGLLDRWKRRNRRKLVMQSRTIRRLDNADIKEYLISVYETQGITWLEQLQRVMREPEKLKWVDPPGRWIFENPSMFDGLYSLREAFEMGWSPTGSIGFLDDIEMVSILKKGDDNTARIDPQFITAVDNLLTELAN